MYAAIFTRLIDCNEIAEDVEPMPPTSVRAASFSVLPLAEPMIWAIYYTMYIKIIQLPGVGSRYVCSK